MLMNLQIKTAHNFFRKTFLLNIDSKAKGSIILKKSILDSYGKESQVLLTWQWRRNTDLSTMNHNHILIQSSQ